MRHFLVASKSGIKTDGTELDLNNYQIIKAETPKEAREKVEKTLGEYYNQAFVYAYLSEVEQVTDENGNECK